MATTWSKLSVGQKILLALTFIPFPIEGGYILSYDPEVAKMRREKKKAEERNFFRNFRVEVSQGFLFDSTKIVQREKPLTDEEMALMYKEDGNN